MAQEHARKVTALFGEKADVRDRLTRERDVADGKHGGFDFQTTFSSLSKTVLPLQDETPDDYRRRLTLMTRQLEAQAFGGVEKVWKARQIARERIDERRERAALRPVNNLTVREELNSSKQNKLRKAKDKFAL